MSGFAQALPFTLRWEGGYVNHPNDRGGATNRGIKQRTYDEWRASFGLSKKDVREIDDSEVQAIYHRDYWMKAYCDALPWPLSMVQFDAAVNHGPKNAVRLLQRAVDVGVDGIWGTDTREAQKAAPRAQTLRLMLSERKCFYHEIVVRRPEQKVFLNGWLRRLDDLRAEVLK